MRADRYTCRMAKKRRGASDQGSPRGDRVITQNRRAFHDYAISDTLETGIVLTGSEIKSIRDGKVTISEAYVRVLRGELWLIGAHINPYEHGAYANHDPDRARKLLAHRNQIEELASEVDRKGMTLVPLRVRLRRGRAKIEIGVARGKKLYDKRQTEIARDARRSIDRALRERG
ncbi:SsrA-binding protein SmpB [soil metagenome]